MKVYLEWDEVYPVYYLLKGDGRYEIEMPDELYEMFKKIDKLFWQMQDYIEANYYRKEKK